MKYCLEVKKKKGNSTKKHPRTIKTQNIWMNGKCIFLGEKRQSEKATYYSMTVLIGHSRKVK